MSSVDHGKKSRPFLLSASRRLPTRNLLFLALSLCAAVLLTATALISSGG